MSMFHRMLAISVILLLVLSACGGGDKEDQTAAETGPTAQATAEPTPTPRPEQPTAAATVAPAEEPTAESGGGEALADLLNLDSLSTNPEGLNQSSLQSYRLRVQWTVEPKPGSDATASDSTIEIAHTRDPLAEQTTFWDEAGTASGMIRIGDKLWFQSGEQWIEVSSDDMASSMDDMFFNLDSVAAGLTGDAKLVGQEDVNGVATRHYTFDESLMGTVLGAYEKVQGDVWVAEEGDYVVKYAFTAEDEKANYRWIWEVYDVNAPFTIEPPAEAQGAREDIPLMPDATGRSTYGAMTSYETASALSAVVDFYMQQMPDQGWSYDEAASTVSEEFATLSFSKEGETVSITLFPGDSGGTSVLIQAGE
jgi:hypothetical protein